MESNMHAQLTPQKGGIQLSQQSLGTQADKRQQQQESTQTQSLATQQQVVPQQSTPPQPNTEPSILLTEVQSKDESMENGTNLKTESGKKKWWTHGKIPTKEKVKRRNAILSKLLQPKCALKILNELAKTPTFNIIDYVSIEGIQFKAVVNVEGVEHVGFGKSKAIAKNAAAETAIKHIFKTRKNAQINSSQISREQDGTEKMYTSESEDAATTDNPLPWQQFASFALYQLFNSWGEVPDIMNDEPVFQNVNPSKKVPENAASLSPVMLVNQIYPHAKFEELQPTGTTPNLTFNTKYTIDDKSFTGSGATKKAAKKNAAFKVCHSLLSIQYPPEVYTPS